MAAGLHAAVRMGTLPAPLAARAIEVAERCASLIRTEGVRDGHLVKWLGGTEVDADPLLPEQVAPLLAPAVLDEWVERWGPSAHLLLWSHGMFLAAVAAFLEPR